MNMIRESLHTIGVGGRWREAGRIYSFILRRSLKLRILPNRSDVLPVNMRCTPCAAVSQYKLCSRAVRNRPWLYVDR